MRTEDNTQCDCVPGQICEPCYWLQVSEQAREAAEEEEWYGASIEVAATKYDISEEQ